MSWALQNEPQHCVQVPLIFFCHLPETRIEKHSPICAVLNLRNAGRVEGGSSLIRHSLAYCRFLFSSIHKDTLAHLLLFIWFLQGAGKAWSLPTHYFRAHRCYLCLIAFPPEDRPECRHTKSQDPTK